MSRALMLVILPLVWTAHASIANAQSVDEVLIPTKREQCTSSWDENNRRAKLLLDELNRCHSTCTNMQVSGSYTNPCGGQIPTQYVYRDGLYYQCAPLQHRLDQYYQLKKDSYDRCLTAVDRVEAARIVWGASSREPESASGYGIAVSKISERVTTGNSLIDAYRDESQQRARNAAVSLQTDSANELYRRLSGTNSTPRPQTTDELRRKRRLEDAKCNFGNTAQEAADCLRQLIKEREAQE